MERLTTNKEVSEMDIFELAHNSCYVKDGKARYRDYDLDEDARVLVRKLLKDYADGDDAFTCEEDFDDWMIDYLQYGMDSVEGLIALFYRNLWAMADLRELLKEYEDLEEQGKLLKLPCKIGDTIWDNDFELPCSYIVTGFSLGEIDDENGIKGLQMHYQKGNGAIRCSCAISEIGKTVFLSKEQAKEALQRETGNG